MKKQKVLVIADDENVLKLTQQYLTKLNCTTRISRSGLEAIRVFESFQPELVFLDAEMAELEGFTTLRKIKALTTDQIKPAKIIMCTTENAKEELIKIIKHGADDCFIKPVKQVTLEEKINQFF